MRRFLYVNQAKMHPFNDVFLWCVFKMCYISSWEMSKMKHSAYSVHEKFQCIEWIHRGRCKAALCREKRIPESDWCRDENKTKAAIDTMETEGPEKKRINCSYYPELDKAQYEWFVEQRSAGVPLTGMLIREHTRKIYKTLERIRKDFSLLKASYFDSSGPMVTNNCASLEIHVPLIWRQQRHLFQNSRNTSKQIYNTDKTGLFLKILPRKTFAQKADTSGAKGFKDQKDRITLLLACNWTGTHKLKPLVNGKY